MLRSTWLPLCLVSLCLLTVPVAAQQIGIDDLDATTGNSNGFPFNWTAGATSLHVYSAAALRARGLCAGATLQDVAVASTGGSGVLVAGVFTSPTAKVQLGHLLVSPPVAGNWATHLDAPITVHDLTSGPYSFAWQMDTWTSLPGMQSTGFVWDGVRDIGIQLTFSTGVTGAFSARASATELRHNVNVFNATNQAPTVGPQAMEVLLSWSPPAGCSSKTVYGTGCYSGCWSFVEAIPGLSAFDLAGAPGAEQVLVGTAGPSGYSVAMGAPAWFTPTSAPVLDNAATPAALGDNRFSRPLNLPFAFPFPGGSTSVVHACDNGYVILGSVTTNFSDSTPSIDELVAQQPRLLPLWCNLHPSLNQSVNPAAGVYFDIDPSNQAAYITWRDSADRFSAAPAAGSSSVNVQVVLHASGNWEFRYGTITPNTNGNGLTLVGWSPGNAFGTPARRPVTQDLSATVPFATTGPDLAPLGLTGGAPQLGTNFTLTTTGVPAVSPFAFLFHGDAQVAGVDLGFLGSPGCGQWSSGNLSSEVVAAAGGIATWTLAIPNDPTWIGDSFTTQAVAFRDNAFGLVMSNGVAWTVGL